MLRWLLFPFSLVYGLVLRCRHLLFDISLFASTSFDSPVIVVGNLAFGGTGKTPHTEYLLRLLAAKNVAVLSRGYGRESRGYILLEDDAQAHLVGDEPLQMKRKFPQVPMAVCEDRVRGINLLKASGSDIIILDDAFQHRKLRPGLSILLLQYKADGKEYLFPMGKLRDLPSRYSKADIVVITKCPPQMTAEERARYASKYPLAKGQVHFSTMDYGTPRAMVSGSERSFSRSTQIVLVTGLADATSLGAYCHEKGTLVAHLEFGDHHVYTAADLRRLKEIFDSFDGPDKVILTSEKDAVKIQALDTFNDFDEIPFCTVPIQVRFIADEGKFDDKLNKYVR